MSKYVFALLVLSFVSIAHAVDLQDPMTPEHYPRSTFRVLASTSCGYCRAFEAQLRRDGFLQHEKPGRIFGYAWVKVPGKDKPEFTKVEFIEMDEFRGALNPPLQEPGSRYGVPRLQIYVDNKLVQEGYGFPRTTNPFFEFVGQTLSQF